MAALMPPWAAIEWARRDLSAEGLVGAEEELLAGLAAAVEGARHERAAEGAVG